MKYKLKRDLPFAKAGEEVFEDDTNFYIEAEVGIIWCFAEIKDKQKLIFEGWIEEVKPREWWEIERTDVSFHYDDRFRSYEDAEDVRNSTYKNSRIIKVQEVME